MQVQLYRSKITIKIFRCSYCQQYRSILLRQQYNYTATASSTTVQQYIDTASSTAVATVNSTIAFDMGVLFNW